MLERIAHRAQRAIDERVFPGCVIGIVRGSGRQAILPFGHTRYDGVESVEAGTLYDVASITKSIPTGSLVLTFISDGRLSLDDLVSDHLPEISNHHGVRVGDLLRYLVVGAKLSTLAHLPPQEIQKRALAEGFSGPAGEMRYTNLPAYLLGLVLERVSGHRLDELAEEHFFTPLGMSHTYMCAAPRHFTVAPTEMDEGGEIRGIPHDESARIFARSDIPVGHAGVFSNASDILVYLEGLLAGGFPHIVDGAQRGLGWQVNQAYFMGNNALPYTFGKTGFTGTSILIDINRDIAFVVLSNRTYPKRPENDDAINQFRRDIADIVLTR